MFQKVAFTMYPVKNHDRARAFYEQVLGLQRGSASRDGVWTEYDLPGGGCLALFRHPDHPVDQSAPELREDGACVAIEVEDLDAARTKLGSAGVTMRDMVHSPVCRMTTIFDTEGNPILLHQLKRT
jgi:predicted enzyme related to lactoylglutathione lyase